jgi:hypothetical protein
MSTASFPSVLSHILAISRKLRSTAEPGKEADAGSYFEDARPPASPKIAATPILNMSAHVFAELFVKLLDEKPVTWSGTKRAPLVNADVFPKTESGHLTTWVGVGGSPQSVIRTARYGLPLMLAFRSPVRKVIPLRPAAALKSGADVSVTVRLDAKVKTAISSIPRTPGPRWSTPTPSTTNRPAVSPARCHIRGPAGVSMA